MNRLSDALPKAWPSFELPGYRDHSATYSGFSYEALPPIEVDDQFHWLENEPKKSKWSLLDWNGEVKRRLQEIEASANLNLSNPFVTFLRSPQFQSRVRSCTACYLELPDYIAPTAGIEDGFLIHFLSDQQWCLHWSLYINQAGEEYVICSEEAYGFEEDEEQQNSQASTGVQPIDLLKEGVAFCAPSFSEFMYRFWIENEIWYKLMDEMPLTVSQQAYVEHFSKNIQK